MTLRKPVSIVMKHKNRMITFSAHTGNDGFNLCTLKREDNKGRNKQDSKYKKGGKNNDKTNISYFTTPG